MTLEIFAKGCVYFLMTVGVFAAIGAVTFRNLFHSGLGLAAVLMCVAGTYMALGAEFLAMVQILVYVGAVMILVIYAIMLTQSMNDRTPLKSNNQRVPALISVILLAVFVGNVLLKTPWVLRVNMTAEQFSTTELGLTLMRDYLLPFELLGVLLFAVLVGAIVVARKEKS